MAGTAIGCRYLTVRVSRSRIFPAILSARRSSRDTGTWNWSARPRDSPTGSRENPEYRIAFVLGLQPRTYVRYTTTSTCPEPPLDPGALGSAGVNVIRATLVCCWRRSSSSCPIVDCSESHGVARPLVALGRVEITPCSESIRSGRNMKSRRASFAASKACGY